MNFEFIGRLEPFGEPDCESDVEILGEERYSRYYLNSTYFNQFALHPSVYLIVGRRGSGKTALSRSFAFQSGMKNSISVDVDEPASFHQVISKIVEQDMLNKELQVPRLVKVWEYIIWSSIFYHLRDRDYRINAACAFNSEEGASKIVRILLQSLLEKYVGSGKGDLSDEIESIFLSSTFTHAQAATLEVARKQPVIVTLDTLENYSTRDPRLMIATSALIEFAAKYNRKYSKQNIHIKLFMMDEIFPYLTEEYISNTLKYVRDEIYLYWRPKDLMRMLCWRLFQYLKMADYSRNLTLETDWEDYQHVKKNIWDKYFGRY
ncbi:MAG: zeta toxin family protein, partial [Cyanobacteria bacterium J06642_2]